MITSFGKELRKIRIDKGELLSDMATALDVSAAFLSAVETGRKSIPPTWISQISQLYQLSLEEINRLNEAAKISVLQVKINLAKASDTKRTAAVAFARCFSSISDDDAERIMKVLGGDAIS